MFYLIIIPLLVSIVTQVIKLAIDGVPKNLNLRDLLSNYGGMPSSHAALVSSLATIIGLESGFNSAPFAIAFILMAIVLRDAVGFRREIGNNAVLTNLISQEVFPENPEVQVRERIGHTPLEATVGTIVGILLTLIFYWLFMAV